MATALQNGTTNGDFHGDGPAKVRFSDIPETIDIPFRDQPGEIVEIVVEDTEPLELASVLETELAERKLWMVAAMAYAKRNEIDSAIDILIKASQVLQTSEARQRVSLTCALCWLYLQKSRQAPRVASEGGAGAMGSERKTKEHYLQLATSSLNDASRINPSFPPLFLARGVLQLLKASLIMPSRSSGQGSVDIEKRDSLLGHALKAFEDALKVSQGKNMLGMMGKARTLYSMGKTADALTTYQEVLRKKPELIDPDPRIGIGCCFWRAGHKEDAKAAWQRSLALNPENKFANILLGLYYLDASGSVPTNSPDFLQLYRKAMTEFTQKSFKLDKNLPLTCATFASYFLSRKKTDTAVGLAYKAIEYTDVNAIASDGWYLLARKEHAEENLDKASDFYRRADDARGGMEKGYLPAKFGGAQLSVLRHDLGEAKLQLEKMIGQSKTTEGQILLGTLYAEEVFANPTSEQKEDKAAALAAHQKAIALLEAVRAAWKDPKKNVTPDPAVLLNLARLYEADQPEKALQCLQQTEELELAQVPAKERPTHTKGEAETRTALRKFLPPQLLNNIGCFYSQADKHALATDMFQAGLSACVRIAETDQEADTDALTTTITFNLGRSYESRGMTDKAVEAYESLLGRHDDYTDARTRLAYIKLRQNPHKEGPDAVVRLHEANGNDLEVRALYGWYLGKVTRAKPVSNLNDDREFRHFKRTLKEHDKHDRYALVAMGNLYLRQAREMRRVTESERAKRSATYSKAVEFFDKALNLDPKNAYAAMGIAIAIAEEEKDLKTALPIFIKVRETVKDHIVFVNLGHAFSDLGQFTKAIESYKTALSREGKEHDSLILSCLGRTYLKKARAEKSVDAYTLSLECAKKALAASPDSVHYKFNVAFVQFSLAVFLNGVKDFKRRTANELESALEGLNAAIPALDEIAADPQTPYPKHDIEQRANMARNTVVKQLERTMAAQREYEDKNKEKIQAAQEQLRAEIRKREEEKARARDAEREREERIRKHREEIAARDVEAARERMEREKEKLMAELTTDEETGEKVRRKKKPAAARRSDGGEDGGGAKPKRSRKKKADDDDGEGGGGEERTAKRRKLASKKESSKFKSAEIIVDSDESGADDDDDDEPVLHDNDEEDELERAERRLQGRRTRTPESDDDDGDNNKNPPPSSRRRRAAAKADEDGDDDDDDEEVAGTKMDVTDRAGAGDDEDGAEVTRRTRARGRGRIVESDDEDEDEDVPRAAAASGDESGDAAPAKDTRMRDVDDDDDDE